MVLSKYVVVTLVLAVGTTVAAGSSTAAPAKMTLERARAACQSQVPHMIMGDHGNSRSVRPVGRSAIQDCVRAKLGKTSG